jgi:hypothetical protein
MRNLRLAAVAVGLAAMLTVTACGSSASGGSHTSGGSQTSGGTQQPAASGPAGTLVLTGSWTYNGPFSGHFVCFHSADGHFELEGQQPYLADINIEGVADGTFDIPNYMKAMTGAVHDPAGAPKIRLSRLQKVGDSSAANYPADAGTITIEHGGDSGVAKWTSTGGGAGNITAELHWTGCTEQD